MTVRLLTGDCREVLRTLPDASVHCVVTSPPYYNLRDYGTAAWEGGDTGCDHKNGPLASPRSTLQGYTSDKVKLAVGGMPHRDTCGKCGATRIDAQIGLENSVEDYVAELVAVFREVRRVLRDDGVLFLNLGDSYAANWNSQRKEGGGGFIDNGRERITRTPGFKPKDLIGVPWRVAFALQADGWYLRSEIIWHKPNPMPESVRDRPTKSHEQIFLLAKSVRYFWDAEAVKEEAEFGRREWSHTNGNMRRAHSLANVESKQGLPSATVRGGDPSTGRNIRSVWTIAEDLFGDIVPEPEPEKPKARGGGFSRKYAEQQPNHGAMRLERPEDTGSRNVRSVWTIATAPFSDWTTSVRQHPVAWDEVFGDTMRRRSPDCLVHEWWDSQHSTPDDGVRVADDLSRIVDSGARLVPVRVSDSDPTRLIAYVEIAPDSWGLLPPFYAQTATGHNTENRRTDAPSGGRDTPDAESLSRIGCSTLSGASPERDDCDTPDWSGTPAGIRRIETCTCSYSRETTESISHFATFPPALAERCIKAGTSEKGACSACGAPWVRVVETSYVPHGESAKSQVKTTFGERNSGDLELGRFRPQEMPYGRASRVDTTTGWQPTCACDAPIVPCVVLDPFSGAGTTALVADRLGRDAIGIDLNPEYVEMSRKRIAGDAPLFAAVELG